MKIRKRIKKMRIKKRRVKRNKSLLQLLKNSKIPYSISKTKNILKNTQKMRNNY